MRRVDIECPKCGQQRQDVYLRVSEAYPFCDCGGQMEWLPTGTGAAIGDDIPGGIEIRHGICNADGTPRRYYSKSEMKREADKRGMRNHVEHVPLPGSDKSPHTVRWI